MTPKQLSPSEASHSALRTPHSALCNRQSAIGNRQCRLRWLSLAFALAALFGSASAWADEPAVPPEPIPSRLEEIKNSTRLVAILGVVGFAAVGSLGLMLLAVARSPERVERVEEVLRRGRWATVLVGLLSVAVIALVGALLGKGIASLAPGVAVLVGLALLGFLVWLGAYGLAGMARIIGRQLLTNETGGQSPWRLVGAGGLALAGTLLLPIFGPPVFLYFLCRGVGAATITLFAGYGARQAVASPPPSASQPPATP